jgi:asparagine synthase (glutamine-hydrolysing)
MCGILFISKVLEIDKLLESIKILQLRGPDSVTYINEKNLINYTMLFTRLKIMDKTNFGNQPFISKDSNIIVMCNGEIFNYKILCEKYNIKCKSNSDCEVLLSLYKKIGFKNMVEELDGDFAIILLDKKESEIYCARDRIGVRPLFIGLKDNDYTNSDEIDEIILSSIGGAIQPICNNFKQVKPGIYKYKLNKNNGKYIVEYSKYPKGKYQRGNLINLDYKEDKLYKLINNKLTKAVEKRLMSNRPIGCLLSGGLDSSLITSILCKLIGSKNVRTYSIGMKGSVDLKFANEVAKYLNTNHTEIIFTEEEGINSIKEVIKSLETYDVTTIRASIPMYLLSKYISKKTEDIVIFSGEGADETLAGYLYFHHAPSPLELYNESTRLVKELYKYDVLRADRCISSNGLELRVPFLDRDFIDLCLSIDGEHKQPINNLEKYILRKSFTDNYLPDNILYRRKCAFSDGCSSDKKSWFENLQEYIDIQVTDDEFKTYQISNPNNKCGFKEEYYYKKIFKSLFPNYNLKIDIWLPKWVDCKGDPSARKFYNASDKHEM